MELIMQLTPEQRISVTRHLLERAHLDISSEQRWDSLIAAHIAGQTIMRLHLQTHAAMLKQAFSQGDARETGGQLLRLFLVPIGHALNRLPMGNTGRSRTNAFTPMPIAPQHRNLIEQALATS